MITFGDARGAHVVALGGNVWGWSAYYVPDGSAFADPTYEGRGFTAEQAVRNLWRQIHG